MSQQDSDTPVVEVAVAPNEITALMWQEILADEGIVAALKPGGAGHSFGSSALMDHLVLVRGDQAERARSILAEINDSSSDDSEG
jgi:hypothetical protein